MGPWPLPRSRRSPYAWRSSRAEVASSRRVRAFWWPRAAVATPPHSPRCSQNCASEPLALTLVLGHVDHGWRGAAAAEADAEAVRALGVRLGVPVALAPPPTACEPRTEAAARRHRYRMLAAQAHAHGLGVIATAHHAGDQAETMLMRLLRGSGPHGLQGIPARRPLQPGPVEVVRPLLQVEPEDLQAWLVERGFTWREDPSNRDPRYERVRARERLARRPAARRTLSALAVRVGERVAARTARPSPRTAACVMRRMRAGKSPAIISAGRLKARPSQAH